MLYLSVNNYLFLSVNTNTTKKKTRCYQDTIKSLQYYLHTLHSLQYYQETLNKLQCVIKKHSLRRTLEGYSTCYYSPQLN